MSKQIQNANDQVLKKAWSVLDMGALSIGVCLVIGTWSLVLLTGCSGGHGTANVTGTVLYKNQPVEGATIIFHPQGDTTTARPAQGKSGSGGHFMLTTYFSPTEQPAGALPGEYKVTVSKIDEPQGAFDPHKDPPPKNHLPVKYMTPQKSPLKVTIHAGSNRPELKLED